MDLIIIVFLFFVSIQFCFCGTFHGRPDSGIVISKCATPLVDLTPIVKDSFYLIPEGSPCSERAIHEELCGTVGKHFLK
jgi:hypothetical protein